MLNLRKPLRIKDLQIKSPFRLTQFDVIMTQLLQTFQPDEPSTPKPQPTKVSGTLYRAIRIRGFSDVLREGHMECACYPDFSTAVS